MKRAKKFLAMLLSMAMVLAMSTTAFAAKITVNDANGAELKYVQVIKADPTGTGIGSYKGWAFTTEAIATAYQEAFSATDFKAVMQTLVEAGGGDSIQGRYGNQIGLALAKVFAITGLNPTSVSVTSDSQIIDNINDAGVYAFEALQDGYTYNFMSAYVGFTAYGSTGATVSDASLTAKKEPIGGDDKKHTTDGDKVVSIGDTVSYTISTNIPYMNPLSTNKTFWVHDELTGGAYDFNSFVIKVNNEVKTTEYAVVSENDGTNFSIDFSGLINSANSNAGQKIEITYDAVITAVSANNTADIGHKDNNTYGGEYGGGDEDIYTGQITLTKTGEGGQTLQGAEFTVNVSGNATLLKFTKEADGVYIYDPANGTTAISTNSSGTVTVKGLNIGEYHFTETKAPDGYSINEKGGDSEIKLVEGKTEADDIVIGSGATVNDTKLSSLPSTGGIGTTIFTVEIGRAHV